MGWTQNTIWNNIFKYAYPFSFLGSMFYCVLAVLQVDINSIVANRNVVIVFNIFIGLCGFFSFAAWYSTDLTMFDGITRTVDFDTDTTKRAIAKSA